MEMKKNKAISIYTLFLQHLIALSCSIIILIIMFIALIVALFQNNVILPANYTDNKIIQTESELATAFDEGLLSPFCSYVIIDDDSVLETNMTEKEMSETKTFLSKGTKQYYDYFKVIEQTNGNILIIKYDLLVHFSNTTLNRVIPYPELMVLVSLFAFIILFSVITARKFSSTLKLNLNPIIHATEKIQNQDLNFEIEQTRITEINTALDAMDKLKQALSASLKEQWASEQQRKLQIAALAHDIKTPLTVIKGNTDLLMEDNLECSELLNYIKISSDNIEKYVELLMDVVVDDDLNVRKEPLVLREFLSMIDIESKALCKTKKIDFIFNHTSKCNHIDADHAFLKRALTNIIDNAVRYSPADGSICFEVSDTDDFMKFDIIDSGKGFSNESLEKATQQFFTEETSRANKNYGLGLSFAKSVADSHGGTLELKNRTDATGAMVSFVIPKNIVQSSEIG